MIRIARWEAAVKQWVAKRQAENPDFVVDSHPLNLTMFISRKFTNFSVSPEK